MSPRVELPRAGSVQPDPSHTVGHGRPFVFRMNRPRGWYPRAPSTYLVRHGGPATFTEPPRRTAHAIFAGPTRIPSMPTRHRLCAGSATDVVAALTLGRSGEASRRTRCCSGAPA